MNLTSLFKRKSTLINRHNDTAVNDELLQQQKNNPDQWQDCGNLFYLLGTLKLTYPTNLGVITIEDLSQDSLTALSNGKLSLPEISTNLPSQCITLSVCGMGWETNAGQKRCKAVDNAAVFRLLNDKSLDSQSQFKHVVLLLDQKSDQLSRYEFKGGTNIIYDLSIKQFLDFLHHENKKFTAKFGKNISIRSANFKHIFSKFEQQILNDSIEYMEQKI